MFVAFIAFSTVAPLWSRLRGKKKAGGKADYVFATGSVSVLAMMLSIARGTLGIRAVLGEYTEVAELKFKESGRCGLHFRRN